MYGHNSTPHTNRFHSQATKSWFSNPIRKSQLPSYDQKSLFIIRKHGGHPQEQLKHNRRSPGDGGKIDFSCCSVSRSPLLSKSITLRPPWIPLWLQVSVAPDWLLSFPRDNPHTANGLSSEFPPHFMISNIKYWTCLKCGTTGYVESKPAMGV